MEKKAAYPAMEAQLTEALSILKELKNQQSVGLERQLCTIESQKQETEKKHFLYKKEVQERMTAIKRRASETKSNILKEIDSLYSEIDFVGQTPTQQRVLKDTEKKWWSEDNFNAFGTGKIFCTRNSRLSELLLLPEFQTIYNIFVAVLFLFLISVMLKSHFETGNAISFSLLIWAFGKLEYVVMVWSVMQLFCFSAFSFKHLILSSVSSHVWVTMYLLFQFLFLLLPAITCLRLALPPASGFIIMCEQIRMIMKIHSFVRVISISKRHHVDDKKADADERVKDEHPFEHYVYFLFCPTLLYRSSYPRTPRIRWSKVVHHLLETGSCTFYTYVVFDRYCVPEYRKTGQEPYSFQTFVLSIFSSMLPATLVFLLGFFGILHSWLNAFAEITQFADREFYRDWWNAKSFSEYYRKWNGVVYDWLHAYAYMDVVRYCTQKKKLDQAKSRIVGSLIVIWLSAIAHEYIIACAVGFFYPILMLQFAGPGLVFIYLTQSFKEHRFSNLFMWTMLLIGNGLLMILYSREFYARDAVGALHSNNSLHSFFIPHSLDFVFN
eukprot:TRINITY_DN2497_c0_g1_i2.p1 TRINITY_DN2497_c0_g1~~TRINITY_DN2497_c0_g1_i2.p1  ORF type:complete len:562 (-),score=61.64 TRINITY_DN2497_c0_g1_i2:13-1668(-)